MVFDTARAAATRTLCLLLTVTPRPAVTSRGWHVIRAAAERTVTHKLASYTVPSCGTGVIIWETFFISIYFVLVVKFSMRERVFKLGPGWARAAPPVSGGGMDR